MPTLAAELWGVPVEQVLGGVRAGTVASRTDGGLMVVNMAPAGQSSVPPPARRSPRRRRPRTYVPAAVLSEAEMAALDAPWQGTPAGGNGVPAAVDSTAVAPTDRAEPSAEALRALDPIAHLASEPTPTTAAPVGFCAPGLDGPAAGCAAGDEGEDGPDPNHGEPDDERPLGWRAARLRVSRTRRRPPPMG